MKKYILLIFIGILTTIFGFSQTTFQKSFDFCGDAVGIAAFEIDEGYFVLSSSFSGCISLMLLDTLGNIKDSNELNFAPELRINAWDDALVQDEDGDIIIFGHVIDSTFWDPYFIKVSTKTLDTIWTTRVRTDEYLENPLSIKRYKDNYLALAEMRIPLWTSDTSLFWYEAKMFFIEIDSKGQILKEVIVEDSMMYSYPGNFVVLEDGNIAVVHDSSDDSFFFHNGYLSFLDSLFNITHTTKIEELRDPSRPTIQVSKNKDRLYVSSQNSTFFPDIRWQNSAKIYCYDLSGNVVWQQDFFTGPTYEVHYGDIAQNHDVIICGRDQRGSRTGTELSRISRMDSLGNTIWDRLYKIPNHPINSSFLFYAIETKDNGILAVGGMRDSDFDIYVLKLDANGCLKPSCDSIIFPFPYIRPVTSSINDKTQSADINVFPNPMFDQLTISIEDKALRNLNLKIYNSFGQVVVVEDNIQNNNTIDISNLISGIYYYSISSERAVLRSGVLSKI